jgi:hypothetical protein
LIELNVNRWMTMKRIFIKWGMRLWSEFMWLSIELISAFCQRGKEPLLLVKDWEFIAYPRDHQLLQPPVHLLLWLYSPLLGPARFFSFLVL